MMKNNKQVGKYRVIKFKGDIVRENDKRVCVLGSSRQLGVNDYEQMHKEIEKRRELMKKTYYSVEKNNAVEAKRGWHQFFRKKKSVY